MARPDPEPTLGEECGQLLIGLLGRELLAVEEHGHLATSPPTGPGVPRRAPRHPQARNSASSAQLHVPESSILRSPWLARHPNSSPPPDKSIPHVLQGALVALGPPPPRPFRARKPADGRPDGSGRRIRCGLAVLTDTTGDFDGCDSRHNRSRPERARRAPAQSP